MRPLLNEMLPSGVGWRRTGQRYFLVGRDIVPVGRSRQTVITGSQVAGVSMVTLSGDRTQLTLTGVQREVDGSTVVCTAFGSPQEVDSNPATVQCRYIMYCNET